jgi:hypothetical protein
MSCTLIAACAPHAGVLCATCEPGHYLTTDFECNSCPALARTIGLGLLAFFGSAALLLYTSYSNLKDNLQDRADEHEEDIEPADVLKLAIVHMQ